MGPRRRCGRAAVAAVDWVGWATGIEGLTRVYPTWPPMRPWTALWLAGLGAAVLLQSGSPSRSRVWVGRGLLRCGCPRRDGLGGVRDRSCVRAGSGVVHRRGEHDANAMARSSDPSAASSVLFLSAAVAMTRSDHRWIRVAWPVCLAGAVTPPLVSVLAYFFDDHSLADFTATTGMSLSHGICAAADTGGDCDGPPRPGSAGLAAHPTRPGRIAAAVGLAIAFPVLVALLRLMLLALGQNENGAFSLAVVVCTGILAVVGFRIRHQEQSLLKDRAEAEMRYHICRQRRRRHRSPPRQPGRLGVALGAGRVRGPPQQWIGSGFRRRVHPDDLDALTDVLRA